MTHSNCLDPVNHTTKGHLFQTLHCTTRKSVKRKRSDDIECPNMEQTRSELNHTTQFEKQSSSNSDLELHEISYKPKKVKYCENA